MKKYNKTKILMPKHLTAENGAKALMMGEFKEKIPFPCPDCLGLGEAFVKCETCDGDGELYQEVIVSWTTIKAIYDMAVEHFKDEARD